MKTSCRNNGKPNIKRLCIECKKELTKKELSRTKVFPVCDKCIKTV